VSEKIYWRQVWGLAALVGATVFCWLAYGFYQPLILTRLGFSELAPLLVIGQGLLGTLVEPGAGLVADRYSQKIGQSLPLITMGITIAGLIFVTLSWLLTIDLPLNLRWVVPVLMTGWVMAMIVFRGPAVAMLVQMAPTKVLPQANSILVLIFNAIGALGPIFDKIVHWIGAPLTFVLGAAVLAGGRWLLVTTPLPLTTPVTPLPPPPAPEICRIYGAGLLCGILSNLLVRWSPERLATIIGGIAPNTLTAIMLAIAALSVWPATRWVQQWGNYRSMQIATGSMGMLLITLPFVPSAGIAVIYILLAGLSFCILGIAQIPWILGRLPRSGLATGLYLGGMGLATAIVSALVMSKPGLPS
jgi:hypothetical protein